MSVVNVPLIPREALFGSPEKARAVISPDGARLAYLAPFDGKLSAWVRTLGKDDARMVAHDPARPIPWLAWQGDSLHLLHLQDVGGNENYHLFRVGLDGSAPLELTPGENVRCTPLSVDHHFPHEALVQINQRNPALFDVARIDLRRGELAVDTENPGNIVAWLADHAHIIRAALAQDPDGSMVIRVRDGSAAPWRDLDRIPSEDFLPQLVAFSPDNHGLYAITAKGANAARLVRYNLASGAYEVLLEDAAYDVSGAYVDPVSNELAAACILRDRLEWKVLDDRFADSFAVLKRLHDGYIHEERVAADRSALSCRGIIMILSSEHAED